MENTTDRLVRDIQRKFIENLPEGLLLIEHLADKFQYHEDIYFEEDIEPIVKSIKQGKNKRPLDKRNIVEYLACQWMLDQIEGDYDENNRTVYYLNKDDLDLNIEFHDYWNCRLSMLEKILKRAPEIINLENILESETKIIINVGHRSYYYEGELTPHPKLFDLIKVYNNGKVYEFEKVSDCKGINATFADVFMFSKKYFIKLSIGENGIIDRVENIIQRDIKKINIVQNQLLEIYFHGLYDPETIVLDSYGEALQLQREISEHR